MFQWNKRIKVNGVTKEWSKLYITIFSSAAPEIPPLQDPSIQTLRTTKKDQLSDTYLFRNW